VIGLRPDLLVSAAALSAATWLWQRHRRCPTIAPCGHFLTVFWAVNLNVVAPSAIPWIGTRLLRLVPTSG
jgi:hypothetical protein